MNQIKVSVIVPVFNVDKYLPECLESLVSQTLQELEIIAVNHGSTDTSQAILEDFAARYPGKIQCCQTANTGIGAARNYGLTKAAGEYIGFVDGGSFAHPDMFRLLYEKAETEMSDVVLCNFVSYTDKQSQTMYAAKQESDFPTNAKQLPELLLDCKPYAWNKLYRRSWFVREGFQFPAEQWFEDSSVVYQIVYRAGCVSLVLEPLYYDRADRVDAIGNIADSRALDILPACQHILDFFNSQPGDAQLQKVVAQLVQAQLFARLQMVMSGDDRDLQQAFYTQMREFACRNQLRWKQKFYPFKHAKRAYGRLCRWMWKKPVLVRGYIRLPRKWKEKLISAGYSEGKKTNRLNPQRLKQLQGLEMDVLKEVDRICRQNGLHYYLGEGTLLGAMRHQGFIPWDDDLDILMLREDYEKFRVVAPQQVAEGYILMNESAEPGYYLPFSKMISRENYGYRSGLGKYFPCYSGPVVDIFPVDYFHTDDAEALKKKHKSIRRLRDMLLLKAGCIKATTLKRKVYKCMSLFVSMKQLHAAVDQEMSSCGKEGKYLCNFASSYHPTRQIVAKEVYGTPRYVPFEDGLFPVPQDAEGLLTKIYGDYMTMPPLDQRRGKHSFIDLTEKKQ